MRSLIRLRRRANLVRRTNQQPGNEAELHPVFLSHILPLSESQPISAARWFRVPATFQSDSMPVIRCDDGLSASHRRDQTICRQSVVRVPLDLSPGLEVCATLMMTGTYSVDSALRRLCVSVSVLHRYVLHQCS